MIARSELDTLLHQARSKIRVERTGAEYIIHTPFAFDDGDGFSLVLRKAGAGWEFSDKGDTMMHLDVLANGPALLKKKSVEAIIDDAVRSHGLVNRGGEFVLPTTLDDCGDALFVFAQSLARMTAAVTAARPVARDVASNFVADVKGIIAEAVPAVPKQFDWHADDDDTALYPVDCRLDPPRATQVFVFAAAHEERADKATMTCLHFKNESVEFSSLVVAPHHCSTKHRAYARLFREAGQVVQPNALRDALRQRFNA